MNSQLLLPLFAIEPLLIKPSPFTSLWGGTIYVAFVILKMLGSKKIFIISSRPSKEQYNHSNVHI
jgi:hypothetical protein